MKYSPRSAKKRVFFYWTGRISQSQPETALINWEINRDYLFGSSIALADLKHMRKVTTLARSFFFAVQLMVKNFSELWMERVFELILLSEFGFRDEFFPLGRLKMWRNRRFIFHAFNQLHKHRLGDKTAFICFFVRKLISDALEKREKTEMYIW